MNRNLQPPRETEWALVVYIFIAIVVSLLVAASSLDEAVNCDHGVLVKGVFGWRCVASGR